MESSCGRPELKPLINAAIEICLLRRGPQDLPSSSYLMWFTSLLYLLAGLPVALDDRFGLVQTMLQSLFDLGLMLGVLYLALHFKGMLPRFNQAATALMLSGFLMTLLTLPLIAWEQRSQSTESGLLLLTLFFWGIVVLGHIIRHTFELSMNLGIAAALLYTLFAWNLMAIIFPVPV
jgi:hypothetical protein